MKKMTARPVSGKVGEVELLIDGKVCTGVRCRPGSARVSDGVIQFTADITCEAYHPEEKQTAAARPATRRKKDQETV